MKIVFLANYPLVDNRKWRQELISEIASKHEVFVIFGKSSILAHAQAYFKRRGEIDVRKRARGNYVKTLPFLKSKGIPVFKTPDANHAHTIDLLRRIKPDFAVASLDQIIRKEVLDEVPFVLNAHYGDLPDIRGWNATEWSILVKKVLHVSLHRVVSRMDDGEIYSKQEVPILKGDDLESLRQKCQMVAKSLYLWFFENPESAMQNAAPNENGKNYYTMNRRLKELTLEVVRKIGTDD